MQPLAKEKERYRVFLPASKAILHLLFQKVTDEIFDGRVKVAVLKLALVLQSATRHLFVLHLFLEISKRQTGGHHLVDAAAHRPPVDRHAVVLLPQDLRSHVAGCTCLRTHNKNSEPLTQSVGLRSKGVLGSSPGMD